MFFRNGPRRQREAPSVATVCGTHNLSSPPPPPPPPHLPSPPPPPFPFPNLDRKKVRERERDQDGLHRVAVARRAKLEDQEQGVSRKVGVHSHWRKVWHRGRVSMGTAKRSSFEKTARKKDCRYVDAFGTAFQIQCQGIVHHTLRELYGDCFARYSDKEFLAAWLVCNSRSRTNITNSTRHDRSSEGMRAEASSCAIIQIRFTRVSASPSASNATFIAEGPESATTL